MLSGTGVLGSTDYAVTQNGSPNMSVNVAPGIIWVPGNQSSVTGMQAVNAGNQSQYGGLSSSFNSQGSYGGYNDATTNLALANSNTNPRIDAICATVQDAFYSGSFNQIILQVVTGTPATSPVPPSIPVSSVVLAQVYVGASVSSVTNANITDERPFMSLAPTTVGKLRATSATVLPGETTIITAGGQTFYLPPSAPRNGTVNTFIAQGGTVTIDGSINHYATTGLSGLTIPQGMLVALMYQAGIWYVTDGGFTPGTLLGSVSWNGSGGTYTASTSTLTALDTTNLRLTEIVPPSGRVRIRASALISTVTNASYLGILNGATNLTSGQVNDIGGTIRVPFESLVTSLTAGSSINFDLGAYESSGGTMTIYYGSSNGPIDYSITAA